MSAKLTRWGILGTSDISQVMAAAINESQISQLAAVGSQSLEKATAFAERFSVPKCYDNYDALLADPEVDVVYIGLPNHLHKEWIMRAAVARKHILCEKPFVTTLQDAQDVFAVVQKANVFCMEALMYRCHPLTLKLLELIKSKVIGEIRFFNAVYTANIATVANPREGGSILNLGCYPVSLIRLLAGKAHNRMTAEPSDLLSIGEISSTTGNDTRASLLMHFPKNMLATVSVADDLEMHAQFDIYGTEGHLQILTNPWKPEKDNNRILIKRHDKVDAMDINVKAEQSLYAYQIDAVSRHILNGDTNAEDDGVSWLDTLGNLVVLEAWNKQVKAKSTLTALEIV